jgi:hypothetical protein
LVSLFGTVVVSAPRFTPWRCAVTCRRALNPVAEILPDRCTPEYERVLATMGASLPYRRARALLSEFLPLGKPQIVETIRRRTLGVGARLEKEAVAGPACKPTATAAATSITLSIDGGHECLTTPVDPRRVRAIDVVVLPEAGGRVQGQIERRRSAGRSVGG